MKGGNFNPTPIDRVNKSVSNSITYRLTYKCYTFLETSGQSLHISPHLGLMKGGNFNPTPIDRVNKSISNIRLTYKCYILLRSTYNYHTFMELSGQVHQTFCTGCPTIGVPKVNLYKNRIFWTLRLVLSNISY